MQCIIFIFWEQQSHTHNTLSKYLNYTMSRIDRLEVVSLEEKTVSRKNYVLNEMRVETLPLIETG